MEAVSVGVVAAAVTSAVASADTTADTTADTIPPDRRLVLVAKPLAAADSAKPPEPQKQSDDVSDEVGATRPTVNQVPEAPDNAPVGVAPRGAAPSNATAPNDTLLSPPTTPAESAPTSRLPELRMRRGWLAQQPRRKAERAARTRAVAFARQARTRGAPAQQTAHALRVSPRTLRHWRQHGDRPIVARGRPRKSCSVAQRNDVLHFLHRVTGPAVGVAALQPLFRDVPRCVLEDLLIRYRRMWRRRYSQNGFRLIWQRPGAVWAMDFSEAKHPIDGQFPQLLPVRDLASHQQLAWQPARGATAEETRAVLRQLFAEHGAPLVMKNDNGSSFTAEVIDELLTTHEVVQLFSPPYTPQYNGALERSNGTLKTYTHQRAIQEGHPFRWSSDDVEFARQLANTLSRPWGPRGRTPEETWQARTPITADERLRFHDTLTERRSEARRDLGLPAHDPPDASLSRSDRARVDRLAITRTLIELGYLKLERVRRPPPKSKRLARRELSQRAAAWRAESPAANPSASPASPVPESSPPLARDGERDSSSPLMPAPEPSVPSPPPQPTDLLAGALGGDERIDDKNFQTLLAKPIAPDTMAQETDVASVSPETPTTSRPSHGEVASTSWYRRFFALILSVVKTAKISH